MPSAIYEIPKVGGDEHVYSQPGPVTSGITDADNDDIIIKCTAKCIYVTLFFHTVMILVLLGISAYLLQMPKPDVVDQIGQRTIDNMTSELSGLKSALFIAEANIKNLTVVNEIGQMTVEKMTSELSGLRSALSMAEAKITNLTDVSTVVFTAKTTASRDVIDRKNIIFPVVLSNKGGGYDSTTGVFTAPYNGLYSFTTTVCAYMHKFVYVQLFAADTAIAATMLVTVPDADNLSRYTCTSISGMAVLDKGNTASVRGAQAQTGAMFEGNSLRWPSFAGMLVHKT